MRVVSSYPWGLGRGHLDNDTPNTPDITLPAVPQIAARVINVATSYHLGREGGKEGGREEGKGGREGGRRVREREGKGLRRKRERGGRK